MNNNEIMEAILSYTRENVKDIKQEDLYDGKIYYMNGNDSTATTVHASFAYITKMNLA